MMIIVVFCAVGAIGLWIDGDKKLGSRFAKCIVLAPIWPIVLGCTILYGIYFLIKIAFYKEKS